MEITKGKWEVSQEPFTLLVTTEIKGKQESICQINKRYKTEYEIECNAKLIADAGNTYQATNKLPSELAEANKELLKQLNNSHELILRVYQYLGSKDNVLAEEMITEMYNIQEQIKKHSNA